MTLPAYKDVGTGSETAPAWPTHIAGDFALLCVSHANVGTSIATPSGWTALAGSPVEVDDTADVICTLFLKVAASSSETAPTITTGGASYVWGVIITFTGVNTTTPVHRSTPGWSGSTVCFSPGLTTLVADSLLVQVIAHSADSVGPYASAESNATPSISLIKRYDAGTTTGNGGGIIIFTGQKATIGIIAPTAFTAVAGFASSLAIALQAADKQLPILERRTRIYNTGAM